MIRSIDQAVRRPKESELEFDIEHQTCVQWQKLSVTSTELLRVAMDNNRDSEVMA